MKVLKYVLAVLFIMGGLGNLFSGSPLSGLFTLILGIVFIPKISELIGTKIKDWDNKILRYGVYIGLFIVSAMFADLGKESKGLVNETETLYKSSNGNYFDQVANNVKDLSEQSKKNRQQLLADLKQSIIYKDLVEKKVISSEYLVLISAVNHGVRVNHINDNGSSSTAISLEQQNEINKQNNPKERLSFVAKVISLTTPSNGGLTKELVEVFDNYKKEYGLFSNAKVQVSTGETIPSFDMTAIFVMMNPKNGKFLNSLFKANKTVSNWFNDDLNFYIPYLANKKAYNNYVKKVYPDSPYVLSVDIEISAKELYRAYDSNQVLADENYKGKKLGITGVVSDIGKDILENPYVTLSADYLDNVNCYFDDDNIKIISKLRKGQKITIIGNCSGRTLTDVVIQDCKVWSN